MDPSRITQSTLAPSQPLFSTFPCFVVFTALAGRCRSPICLFFISASPRANPMGAGFDSDIPWIRAMSTDGQDAQLTSQTSQGRQPSQSQPPGAASPSMDRGDPPPLVRERSQPAGHINHSGRFLAHDLQHGMGVPIRSAGSRLGPGSWEPGGAGAGSDEQLLL